MGIEFGDMGVRDKGIDLSSNFPIPSLPKLYPLIPIFLYSH